MKTVFSGRNTAAKNMEIDANLLKGLKPNDTPILRFYDFIGPAATYGYFLQPGDFLRANTLDVARRPTGGGMLFHMWDLTFSLFIPSGHPFYTIDTMANYRRVHEVVLEAIKEFARPLYRIHLMAQDPLPLYPVTEYFCFAKPTQYDVMIAGKKVAGAAQRRKRHGFLHQGSISLMMPDFEFLKSVIAPEIIESMKLYTYAPLSSSNLAEAKRELAQLLQKAFSAI